VFAIALAVRGLYAIGAPAIIYGPDSSGYYSIGENIFTHPSFKTMIHPYRTTLYPFFINAVFYSIGLGGVAEGSPAFTRGLQAVVVIQMIFGAASFAIFYQTIKRWIPEILHRLLGMFILLDVFAFGWERSILTEGIAVSLLLVITAALFHTIRTPTRRSFVVLFFLFTLGFFLRPAFLTIPIATIPILAWHFRKKPVVIVSSLITLIGFLIVPITYAQINGIESGYKGIQIVGDIDILGRILEERLPIEPARDYHYFYTTVRDYETKNLTAHPFRFLEYYDPYIYEKMDRFNELHGFNQTVIFHALPQFLTKAVINIPEVLLEVNIFTQVKPSKTNTLTTIVWAIQQVYGDIQSLTLLVPFIWAVEILVWLKKPTGAHTLTILLGTMVMSQILLTAAIVYKDYGGQYQRIISVIRPQMFVFLFLSAYQWYTRERPTW
jgi:hypothetical protein